MSDPRLDELERMLPTLEGRARGILDALQRADTHRHAGMVLAMAVAEWSAASASPTREVFEQWLTATRRIVALYD
jgi:hypothetical protein